MLVQVGKYRNYNSTCLIPCQWIARFPNNSLFVSSIMTVSPSWAKIVGPGDFPLIYTMHTMECKEK